MSADRYIGTAVLAPGTGPDDWGGLLLLAEWGRDGKRFEDYLPVYEHGTPAPTLVSSTGRQAPFWCYRKQGKTLDVTPSVLHTDNGWHNAGRWSVDFEEWDRATYPNGPHAQFLARNRDLFQP